MVAKTLPLELWLRVFQFATDVPGAYTDEDSQAITAFALDQHGIVSRRQHREATNTMIVALRVCKTWYPLATSCLFKYLFIKSGEHAVSIVEYLDLFTACKTVVPASHRLSAVRLELALQGDHQWEERHTTAIARFFAMCPNIRVFSTALFSGEPMFRDETHFMKTVEHVGMQSHIRRLELKANDYFVFSILSRLSPSLKVLWVLPHQDGGLRPFWETSHLCFPHLHTLILPPGCRISDGPYSWTAPALRCLAMQEHLPAFFTAHAPGLERFVSGTGPVNTLDLCTNLTEWTCSTLAIVPAISSQLPPRIRVLTIVDEPSDPALATNGSIVLSPTLAYYLHRFLKDPQNIPSLKRLRFLLPLRRVTTPPLNPHEWRKAFKTL